MDEENKTICYTFGIGDIIILKEFCLETNFNLKKIFINKSTLSYRLNGMNYFIFIKSLVEKLFDNCEVLLVNNMKIVDGSIIRKNFKIKNLYKEYNFKFKYNNCFFNKEPYVIFHTKCRLSTDLSLKFFISQIPKLALFFENFKSKFKIILMGEKEIEQNKEAIALKIKSVYNILLKLKNNNDVMDLTSNMLCSSNSIYNFENEMHIINKASYNITFGEGGNFVICNSFCENNICYIGLDNYTNHMPFQYENISLRDLDIFLNEIKEKC